jgi:hypothetical protein
MIDTYERKMGEESSDSNDDSDFLDGKIIYI